MNDYSAEFHRSLWIFDITPPFEVYKKLNLLWRCIGYLLAFMVDKKIDSEKIKDVEDRLLKKVELMYTNNKILEAYQKYKITNNRDIKSAAVLIETAAKLNFIRHELLILAKAVGLDRIDLAVLENVSVDQH